MQRAQMFKRALGGDETVPWWDEIVLTAFDERQAERFRAALAAVPLPPRGRLRVVADPAGSERIGNGGSTLAVLRLLEEEKETRGTGERAARRVLLMHCGGFSKRLPTQSIDGKAFAKTPFLLDGRAATMLELKLVSLAHLPASMPAGVFVTCSDDIVLLADERVPFAPTGFTALGHPGSVRLGTSHGVFAPASSDMDDGIQPRRVADFLHKRSEEDIRAAYGLAADDEESRIWTDSAFFISAPAATALLAAKDPPQGEIDCYADFLCAVASTSRPYARWPALAEALGAHRLHVVQDAASAFYHCGTMPELLEQYCDDACFRARLGVDEKQPRAVLIASHAADDATFDGAAVVTDSSVGSAARIGDRCVLANVAVPDGAHVPPGTCLIGLAVGPDAHALARFDVDEDVKDIFHTRSFAVCASPAAAWRATMDSADDGAARTTLHQLLV